MPDTALDEIVLSRFQAQPLLAARAAVGEAGSEAGLASTVEVSLDLGLTQTDVALTPEGIVFPNGARLSWEQVERIQRAEDQCFEIAGSVTHSEARSIQVFSETTNWLRSLMPTGPTSAPTMLVAGFPMHRIKDTDPWQDTLKKVAAAGPITGAVLDTATGLGYTAIAAARTASAVTTIELDPAGLEVARHNPWSRDLFANPKIHQITGDAFAEVRTLGDSAFSVILHDPPTLSLAGDLYSAAFYRELWRVLARGGRLFHYIGDPTSALGKRTTAGVTRRLHDSGFRRIIPHPEAFGLTAMK
ncbi:MAG: Spermidine synthase [Ktedonobacterales bacterium]|jgi:predicted methyltransferase|nr:MAG: Spermidine synthase [Ktedonobacterales bacterium]